MQVSSLSEADFPARVLANPLPVVVDFWATWCAPCKAIAPILQELAQEMNGEVEFVKVDADECGDLAVEYGVRALPTLILFRGGDEVDRRAGAATKAALAQWIKQASAG